MIHKLCNRYSLVIDSFRIRRAGFLSFICKLSAMACPGSVEAHNSFSFNLYSTIADSSDGNIFFSPLSISMTLSMLLVGSAENTRAELLGLLHQLDDNAKIRAESKKIMDNLQNDAMQIANMVFYSNSSSVKREYTEILGSDFNAKAEVLDFGQSDLASKT